MRLFYVTTDETNHALAAQMARPFDADVVSVHSDEPLRDDHVAAVMYDLDRVPATDRRSLLAEILSGRMQCPVAVHGYALAEEDALTLRLGGVAVAQRLRQDLVETLCNSAARGVQAMHKTPDSMVNESPARRTKLAMHETWSISE
jgi:hypothetical protein